VPPPILVDAGDQGCYGLTTPVRDLSRAIPELAFKADSRPVASNGNGMLGHWRFHDGLPAGGNTISLMKDCILPRLACLDGAQAPLKRRNGRMRRRGNQEYPAAFYSRTSWVTTLPRQ